MATSRGGKFAEDYKTFKARLEGLGTWPSYCARQRELQKTGISRNEQLEILNVEFGRLRTGVSPAEKVVAEFKSANPDPGEVVEKVELPDLSLMSQVCAKKLTANKVTDAESIRWVLENIHVDGLSPADAPSLVAWSYYQYAKSNKKAYAGFMETIAPKVLNVKEEAKLEEDITTGSERQVEMIDKLIKKYLKKEQDETSNLSNS